MSVTRLPEEVTAGLEAIRAATEDLIRAAQGDDAEGIHAALERRAAAIEQLEPRVVHLRRDADARVDELLRREGKIIADRSREAEAELIQVRKRVRVTGARMARGETALRGYGSPSRSTGGFERSG